MRRFIITVLSIAASTGTTLSQDLEAGEASFRKCAPCHDAGEDAKIKVGPPLNGLTAARLGRSRASTIATRTRPEASLGARIYSRNTSEIRVPRSPALR